MIGKKGFFDLSVSSNQIESELTNTLHTLVKWGYKTVAINNSLDESIFVQSDKKIKKAVPQIKDYVPCPKSIDHIVKEFEGKLEIVHRLTVTMSNKDQAHKLSQSKNLMKYNLIAIIPTSDVMFQFACSAMKVDIISFDPSVKFMIKMNRNMYNMAVDRGVYFELMYGPAIQDSNCRRNIMCMGHMYHTLGKAKNIIISSSASNSLQIRGPYDIINLGLIFGLSEEQSKGAILNVSRRLLITAGGRCLGKAVVLVKRHKDDNGEPEDDTNVAKKARLKFNESDEDMQ